MTNVRQCLMLCILLLTGSGTAFSVSYPKMFGDDWTSAVQFIDAHHTAWKPLFEEFGVDARLAEAIVFPELIRYSKWQDEIETAAVQMKPSFAEEVEAAWNQSPLAKEYGFVFNLQDGVEARRSRIRRLDTMEGQCRYLAIFIRLQFLQHPQLQALQLVDQVGMLATIYNRSFSTTWEQVCQLRHQKHFHTDIIVILRSFSKPNCWLFKALPSFARLVLGS